MAQRFLLKALSGVLVKLVVDHDRKGKWDEDVFVAAAIFSLSLVVHEEDEQCEDFPFLNFHENPKDIMCQNVTSSVLPQFAARTHSN